MSNSTLVIIYDGQCPFCQNYVQLMALRDAVSDVNLVDARSDNPLVADVMARGYNLDEGMVAIFEGEIYYGSDALALISSLSSNRTALQRIFSKFMQNPVFARYIYPYMKFGRSLTLKILGRHKISEGKRQI